MKTFPNAVQIDGSSMWIVSTQAGFKKALKATGFQGEPSSYPLTYPSLVSFAQGYRGYDYVDCSCVPLDKAKAAVNAAEKRRRMTIALPDQAEHLAHHLVKACPWLVPALAMTTRVPHSTVSAKRGLAILSNGVERTHFLVTPAGTFKMVDDFIGLGRWLRNDPDGHIEISGLVFSPLSVTENHLLAAIKSVKGIEVPQTMLPRRRHKKDDTIRLDGKGYLDLLEPLYNPDNYQIFIDTIMKKVNA